MARQRRLATVAGLSDGREGAGVRRCRGRDASAQQPVWLIAGKSLGEPV
ncbi:hypothetical protein [Paenibacillus rhizophilus]|nr:hypothetical protein [Paenibacillus rhizophilus]